MLTMMLAEAAHNAAAGPLTDFRMSDKDRYELKIAGLLHDCGKITTPVHVVDKATKLQTIFDRIELVATRFEVLKREAEVEMLRAKLQALEHDDAAERAARRRGVRGEDPAVQRRPRVPAPHQHRQRAHAAPRTRRASRRSRATRGATRRARPSVSCSKDEEDNLNIAYGTLNARRARDHQPPHRGHDQDARGAALAAPPHQRARVRRRPPRAHGRQGLSARASRASR